jgi:hypothetical protein
MKLKKLDVKQFFLFVFFQLLHFFAQLFFKTKY